MSQSNVGQALRLCFSLFLLAFCCWADAGPISYSGNGGSFLPQPITSATSSDFVRLMSQPTTLGQDVVDSAAAKIGTKEFQVLLTRNLPKAGLLTAAARGARGLASLSVPGLVITAASSAAWCKYSTGSWLCDPMTPPVAQDLWVCQFPNGPSGQSSLAYGPNSYDACFNSFSKYSSYVTRDQSFSGGTCIAHFSYAFGGGTGPAYSAIETISSPNNCAGPSTPHANGGGTATRTTATVCPPVVGLVGYQAPGGAQDSTGKCPTGSFSPASESDVTTRLGRTITTADQIGNLVKDLTSAGIDLAPYANPGSGTLSGPSRVTQDPVTTTTTSPSGQPSTTTQTTTNNITYNTNNFTWTNSTTTVNPDGSSQTQTETPDDPKSECEKNPDSIGCQKPGDVGSPEDIPRNSVPISFTPVDFTSNASCPADIPVSMGRFGSFVLSFGPFCNWTASIAPIFIALAAIAAAMIFMDGLKA